MASKNTFQKNLEVLDLEPIAQRLMYPEYGLGWERQQVSRAIAHYKMFLHLIYLYPNRAIIPTREIDTVWHYHILDTQKYACDCKFLFGYFLHHKPNFNYESETARLALSKAFAETKVLFVEHFGISFDESDNNEGACFILTNNNLLRASACVDPCSKAWLLR